MHAVCLLVCFSNKGHSKHQLHNFTLSPCVKRDKKLEIFISCPDAKALCLRLYHQAVNTGLLFTQPGSHNRPWQVHDSQCTKEY